MNEIKYIIKDDCRKNLINYTIDAFSVIPELTNPLILDAGCGTGQPSLSLMALCNGILYAVDTDKSALSYFYKKVIAFQLEDRIKIICDSILNPSLFNFKFDIILAEGILNIIGFKKGLQIFINILKDNGYIIIHDEVKNDSQKRLYFKENRLRLLHTFVIDEKAWWKEYFNCLEMKIKNSENKVIFQNEIKEITDYKNNPNNFRSIYYILQSTSRSNIHR